MRRVVVGGVALWFPVRARAGGVALRSSARALAEAVPAAAASASNATARQLRDLIGTLHAKARATTQQSQHEARAHHRHTAGARPCAQLDALVRTAPDHVLRVCGSRGLASAAWATARLDPTTAHAFLHGVAKLLSTQDKGGEWMEGCEHGAMLAHALARSGVGKSAIGQRALGVVAGAVGGHVGTMEARSLAGLAWSFSECGFKSPGFFQLVARRLFSHPGSFAPRQLATLLASFAAVDFTLPPSSVRRLDVRLVALLPRFTPHEVAQLVFSMAKANATTGRHELVQAIAQRVGATYTAFRPDHNLFTVVWGLGKLGGAQARQLLRDLAPYVAARVGNVHAGKVTQLLYGYAKSGVRHEGLLRAAGDVVQRGARAAEERWLNQRQPALPDNHRALAPHEMVLAAWSFATLDFRALEAFANIARALQSFGGPHYTPAITTELSPVGVSVLLWSFAKLGVSPSCLPHRVEEMARDPHGRLRGFPVPQLVVIAWALARTEEEGARRSLEVLCPWLLHSLHTCRPRHIAMLVWAVAVSRTAVHASFLDEVVAVTLRRAAEFAPSELCNVAWSLAVAGAVTPALGELVRTAYQRVACRDAPSTSHQHDPWDDEFPLPAPDAPSPRLDRQAQLSRLHHAHLALVAHSPVPYSHLPGRALRKMRAACVNRGPSRDAATMSALQADVLQAARRLASVRVHPEFVTPEGLVVDALVETVVHDGDDGHERTAARRVVLEVHGPHHFFRGSHTTLNGRSAFKRRLLEGLGWSVVTVPFFAWDASLHPDAKTGLLAEWLGVPLRTREHCG